MAEVGRRETKRLETHHALRDAAFGLFAQRGFGETRVVDIAQACGISERTFFRYFTSKEDVALYAMKAWMDELFHAIESLPDSYGPIEAIGAVLQQADAGRFVFGVEQGRDVVAYLQFPEVRQHFTQISDQMRLRLVADFARRSGMSELDPYPRVLASIINAGLFAVMESWLHSPTAEDPWRLARETLTRVARDFADADLSADRSRRRVSARSGSGASTT
jgi:AcrR family transcriptional regulator